MYGLPIHFGKFGYPDGIIDNEIGGEIFIKNPNGHFRYRLRTAKKVDYTQFEAESLGEFLGERYTAYVRGNGNKKFFRIWHHPWPQTTLRPVYIDDGLLSNMGQWGKEASFV
ncbi:MAG: hypothetical protein GTN99_10520, partial [Candidatus Dadabacteria bacterium]|nr:hypothetical protein [Candidatus Dadabacteria bacterium]